MLQRSLLNSRPLTQPARPHPELFLDSAERKGLLKTGPDSTSFVQNAPVAAQNNAIIFPASFNTPDLLKDLDLLATLTELSTLASSVASRIDDTRIAVGSEAT
jgi:hypothetical protein